MTGPAVASMVVWGAVLVGVGGGCGDRCEQLCVQAGSELQRCKPAGLDWRDLGARSRADFTNGCREAWDRTSSDLTATEVREALEVCGETSQALEEMTCEEIAAIYTDLD